MQFLSCFSHNLECTLRSSPSRREVGGDLDDLDDQVDPFTICFRKWRRTRDKRPSQYRWTIKRQHLYRHPGSERPDDNYSSGMRIMLRKSLAALALVPLALGAAQQEEFEVLLEDMVEKVCLAYTVRDRLVAACLGSCRTLIFQTVPLRTHSLVSPYVDSDLQNRWWDFGQDAIVVCFHITPLLFFERLGAHHSSNIPQLNHMTDPVLMSRTRTNTSA